MLPLGKKILVVDDDAQMREAISSILIKIGFKKIVTAESAADAKQLLTKAYDEKDPFDLVLSDHHMPGNTGLDFISYVRASLRFKDLGFITITSDAQRSVVLPHISAGADAYIVKPVNEKDLQAKITQVWTKRGVIPK